MEFIIVTILFISYLVDNQSINCKFENMKSWWNDEKEMQNLKKRGVIKFDFVQIVEINLIDWKKTKLIFNVIFFLKGNIQISSHSFQNLFLTFVFVQLKNMLLTFIFKDLTLTYNSLHVHLTQQKITTKKIHARSAYWTKLVWTCLP